LEQDHAEGSLDEYGGVVTSWIAEGDTKPYQEPRFVQEKVVTNEIAARTEISRTMLRRSALDLRAIITRLFRGSLLNELDKAILTGDGTGKPLGIMNTVGINTVSRLNANNVQYDDLVNLEFAILGHHRANAQYGIADGAMKVLKKSVDGEGRPLFSVDTSQQMRQMLVGYPFRSTHRLTLGEDDVVFGDWAWYFTAVEEDVVMLMSEHEKFSKNLVVFAVFALFGGKAVIPTAFAKLNKVNS
jgi:HK97 family phage major capsid protein